MHIFYNDTIEISKFLRNEDLMVRQAQQTSKFGCPNLPGFKNLAGLIPDFI
jgi:hypothetical protein